MDIYVKGMRRLTMWKHTKFGNVLLWIGYILVFVGLCMTNVISDIPFFLENIKQLELYLYV